MKFCPQCGTTFEPAARFCLECGFDKSTVEPAEPTVISTPGVVVTETVISPAAPLEVAPSPSENKPGCPQCGSVLDTGDRFCQECGYDTSVIGITRPEISQHAEPLVDEEEYAPVSTVTEPELVKEEKRLCPQCSSGITSDDRFCQECGFDTSSDTDLGNRNFRPVDQPEAIHRQEAMYTSPIVEKAPPPIPMQQPEYVITPKVEPVRAQTPAYVPPIRTTEPPTQRKGKKTWLWIVVIIFGLGAVGVAGWFGYKAYFDTKDANASDTIANMELPPISDIDTSTMKTEVTEESGAITSEQPQATGKPLSKIDQELARQRAKEQNKPIQQTTKPEQKPKPDESVKAPTNTTVNDNLAKVLLEVGRKEEPKSKNPKNPTKLMIQKPTMIVRITTDHYNNGMGTPGGGTISIKDRDGNVIGAYKAFGKKGKNGTPSAKWVIEPRVVLEKGTYFIWDSDMASWSKTFVGSGFVVVEGYVVE